MALTAAAPMLGFIRRRLAHGDLYFIANTGPTPIDTRARFIGGFGAIHWVDQLVLANAFAGEGEVAMLEHMNSDHANAIAHYVELAGLPKDPGAEMVGIDTEGFHLRIGQTLHWLPFPTSCNNPGAVRQALVQLARAESWPTSGEAVA